MLGVVPVYRAAGFIQAQTPGSRDVLVFEEGASRPGRARRHRAFRLRLVDPADMDRAVAAVGAAGGTIRDQGEFCPGEPDVFFTDPDGHEVEIWHELPIPLDP